MIRILAIILALLLPACATRTPPAPMRVLFVGNSLTYYNDLPAKFSALYAASHPHRGIEADMLAAGGASLRDRLRDGSLQRELSASRHDVVVLQDFGGWPLCDPAIPACEEGSGSLREAVALVRRSGARPIWYATWFADPDMQRALSAADANIAAKLGVAHADVGASMTRASALVPGLLHADGHPDVAGSWLAAAALLHAIEPEMPLPQAPPTACGGRWQGANLRGDALASTQPPVKTECEALSPDRWEAIRATASR